MVVMKRFFFGLDSLILSWAFVSQGVTSGPGRIVTLSGFMRKV